MSGTVRHCTLGGADHYRRQTGWQKGTCTWCRAATKSGVKWCSDACILAYLAVNNPHDRRVRVEVWKRDGGACRGCARVLRHVEAPAELWRRYQWWNWPPAERWDLDHVVPVAEGGGALGMGNLQVLCRTCHKAKTAEQAARRAKPKPPDPQVGQQQGLFGGAP